MTRMQVPVELPIDEIRFLGDLAEQKHCTLGDMIEEAVAVYAERERRRRENHGS